MKDSGLKGSDVGMEFNTGLMDQFTKDLGETTWRTAKADLFMQTATLIKVTGSMIERKVLELIITQMVHLMKENGLRINSMEKAKKCGQMVQATLATTK